MRLDSRTFSAMSSDTSSSGGREESLNERLRELALAVVELSESLPYGNSQFVLGKQLMRAGTAPGAMYREATHARTDEEFVSKLHVALQELEETRYWLELVGARYPAHRPTIRQLYRESKELTAIFVTMARKADSE